MDQPLGPKHAIVSEVSFHLSAEGVEVYSLIISELANTDSTIVTKELDSIPTEYQDLHVAFSEKSSNELPSHGISDMKIEFKVGHEPKNIGLRPMSPIELEELRHYLE